MAVSLSTIAGTSRAGRAALILGLILAVAALARPGLAGRNSPATGKQAAGAVARLKALAVGVQSSISTKIGSTDPEFAARGSRGEYALRGGGVSATLGRAGARIAGDGSVSMALTAVGRGARLDPVGEAGLGAQGNRVVYRYRRVREWYAAGPLGIEQGFTVARPPAGARAPLTLALNLSGSLSARRAGSGLRFVAPSGQIALRYGGLAAVDATGRSLPATLALGHGRLLVLVRDRGARYPIRIDPLIQLGAKLTGGGELGAAKFGTAAALSSDGSTALIGGPYDHSSAGAAWVFVKSGSTWTQQAKLTASNEVGGASQFGFSVALSSNGDVALIGGVFDGSSVGAAWVFVRSGSTWTQQAKLTANDENGGGELGFSVALSSNGTTALVGGPLDHSAVGAAWVFTSSGATWTQAATLTAHQELGAGWFGTGVALSSSGATAVVGGEVDNSSVGAAWVFTSSPMWTQQAKLTADDAVGAALLGSWVALSGDGSTALIGGFGDNGSSGAAWVFSDSGSGWSQVGSKLTPTDETGAGRFGIRVALAADGNTALIGGSLDNSGVGAAWLFTRAGATWKQLGGKLTANDETGAGQFGFSTALSANGTTALIGGQEDNNHAGAAWVFGNPPPTCSNTGAVTAVGGGTVALALQCTAPAGIPLSYAILTGPGHGVLGPINQAGATVSYTPVPGYTGTDQFTYHASGADGVSNTATATITIPGVPPAIVRLNPTIGYTFRAGPRSTLLEALFLSGVPSAAQVHISCRGRRCPFKAHVARVPRRKVCKGKGKHRRCARRPPPRVGTVTLTPFFHHRHLTIGTKLTISVVETGAIGKVYVLTVRPSRGPTIRVSCLAPGSAKPGLGC